MSQKKYGTKREGTLTGKNDLVLELVIQKEYGAMNPLLAYTLALMHLSAFYIPRGSGETTWEPMSTSTSTATPCFRAEISGSEQPDTPQIQQVFGALNPLLAYTLALMHLPAFHIPGGSGKTTWEPVSTSTSTATPCFLVQNSGSESPHTPSLYGALYSGWWMGYMVQYTHLCVVGCICKDTDDSVIYDVQGVLDTQ